MPAEIRIVAADLAVERVRIRVKQGGHNIPEATIRRRFESGLRNFNDVYQRLVSFEPDNHNLEKRLFDAYAAEVARVDTNGDGVVSALEGDVDTASDEFENNRRLFIPATQYTRFAVTRELNDGLLAPRFAPSQRAWVLSGSLVQVTPSVPASSGRDGDDR